MQLHQSLCVHAHFYQPPREDLLTGLIPDEPGAWPFKNWNERIFENCYKPNAELGNFSKISFNIGPTLAEWLKQYHPETLAQIVQADQLNVERYGVGNAMAQTYHHTILPLSSRRDKQTQIFWGIYEFEQIFHRKPQGMWLPETAVDMETLEILVDNGMEYTILAPWQADENDVDPRKAYQVLLSEGRSIKVFFYHSGLSSRISFDAGATENADFFIDQFVKNEFSLKSEEQWIMLASDGELYGHHQTFRDKFLSFLLNGSLTNQNLDYSFPGMQLKKQEVFPEVKILEDTSWSCHHGIERWRGVCACTINSEWKKNLRGALDQLRKMIDEVFFRSCQSWFDRPWEVRDRYIEVFCGEKQFTSWLTEQTGLEFSTQEADQLSMLFEAQLDSQKMFTSCGWFFEDFDRIEPRNNVACAAHAVWLIKQATGVDLGSEIMESLEKVRSWRSGITAVAVFTKSLQRFDLENQKFSTINSLVS